MRKTSTQLERLRKSRKGVKAKDPLLAKKPPQPKMPGFTRRGARGV
ncbi:MAG TPA: hypothetical protein VFI41_12615 [Gemmatimonadales bacterium]|nr:hypothetical protein [Gemmatimonadales bacterium]